eukprot:11814.XXX_580963_581196_1 [CDS] Oithona nana genome sequencing.
MVVKAVGKNNRIISWQKVTCPASKAKSGLVQKSGPLIAPLISSSAEGLEYKAATRTSSNLQVSQSQAFSRLQDPSKP